MNGQGAPTAEIGPNSGFWVPTFWRSRAIWLERCRRKMHHTATDRPHQVWGTKSFGPSKAGLRPGSCQVEVSAELPTITAYRIRSPQ